MSADMTAGRSTHEVGGRKQHDGARIGWGGTTHARTTSPLHTVNYSVIVVGRSVRLAAGSQRRAARLPGRRDGRALPRRSLVAGVEQLAARRHVGRRRQRTPAAGLALDAAAARQGPIQRPAAPRSRRRALGRRKEPPQVGAERAGSRPRLRIAES